MQSHRAPPRVEPGRPPVRGARTTGLKRTALSAAQARRIALSAQGFDRGRPQNASGSRALVSVVDRIGLVQIDSVNVLVRSHYLPFFSRLGPYDTGLLERLVWQKSTRKLFEYWGHEASLLPLRLHPLLRWRMARAERGEGTWGRVAQIARDQPALVASILAEVERRGPLASGDIAEHRSGKGGWWGWSDVKTAFEYLFWCGALTTARRRHFERLYDLPERVLPAAILALPTPSEDAAKRELLRLSAQAMGVATRSDLRDYFRLDADANARIDELVEQGDLVPVAVEGWKQPAYLARDCVIPRRLEARALLSPFDSLVWERARDRRLFDFDYRIEIYTPAHKRVHGYYVLPFLHGDRLAARVDLKAQRDAGVLDVIAVHYEDEQPSMNLRDDLLTEMHALAGWLGLATVRVRRAAALSRESGASLPP